MGADRITFNLYENSCGRQDSKFFAPAEDIFWLSKSIESIKQECENIIIDYSPSLFDFFISQRGLDQVGRHYYRGVCGAYKSSMIIREDGKVVYCEYLSELEETVIGDLNTSSIVEVWNSERYTNFSRPSKDLFTGTHCEMCEEFDACLNRRCYFRTKQAYGKLYDVDPMCKYGDVFFVRH